MLRNLRLAYWLFMIRKNLLFISQKPERSIIKKVAGISLRVPLKYHVRRLSKTDMPLARSVNPSATKRL
jgi:hypothetical protein